MLFPRENKFRNVKILDGFWSLKFDKNDEGEKQAWCKGLKNANPVAISAPWNEQYPDFKNYMGTVWYECKTVIAKSWEKEFVWLRFCGVNWNAKVWINGKELGTHSGGFISFEYQINDLIKTGDENLIVVKVDMKLSRETLLQDGKGIGHWAKFGDKYPPSSGDYFPWGGIIRPVYVYTVPKTYIQDITLNTDISGKAGVIKYQIELNSKPLNGLVKVTVTDKAGTVVAQGSGLSGTVRVEKAEFWCAETPHLYSFEAALIVNGATADAYCLKTGIKKIEIKKDAVLINGKSVYFRGFSRHDDLAVIGAGFNRALIVRDFQLLKWIGANILRPGHYPPSEELLDLADETGIYIIDEVPANAFYSTKNPNDKPKDMVPPAFIENHKNAVKAMVTRDKNHASVIAWSIANECNSTLNECAVHLKKIYDYTKTLDGRPVVFMNCMDDDDKASGHFDIICMNMYFFLYNEGGDWDKVQKTMSDICDKMYKRFKKPMLISEFGADGIAGEHAHPAVFYTEDYQTEHVLKYLDVFEKKSYIRGTMVWAFADFLVSQHFGRAILNRKGVFNRDRNPKRSEKNQSVITDKM